ncbi:MAG: M48 family metalloprotease [Pegethrix bostrychoides GSE-TBD4-15B]|uniref:M48 family metalloprotease n=1 Tax=Pegethrix bostrychoides GSE-TBD4-15B TaxID=2839662 RepID=A0A951P758_9CYAN|nr:M48 family metalloprotease [Pegethrix bostrychoides GSE-TBD4-15B]
MSPTLKSRLSLGCQTFGKSPMLRKALRKLSRKQLGYFLLAILIAMSLWLGQAQVSQASRVQDRIRGGTQTTETVQHSRLSPEQEIRVGQKMNRDLLRSGEFRLYRNPDIQNYVVGIGERLLPYSDRADELTYTFQVIADDQVNAFATMGGYVYVTTGLMKFADNEAQLASVVGHEIGHIDGKHLLEQIRADAVRRGLMTATGLDESTIAQIGVELLRERPNSRENEYDADQRGLSMMGDAGYAQSAMPDFMQKLADQSGSPPEFLSTHPAPENRVEALEVSIDPNQRNSDGLDSTAYYNRTQALR